MPKPSFLAAEQRIKEENKGKPHGKTLYCVMPFTDVTEALVNLACETSIDTLRHTISGQDRVLLKFGTEKKELLKAMAPGEVSNLIKNFEWFTNEEIHTELLKDEWIDDMLAS